MMVYGNLFIQEKALVGNKNKYSVMKHIAFSGVLFAYKKLIRKDDCNEKH